MLPSPRLRRTATPSTDEPRGRSGRRASVIEAVYPYWGLTYSDLRYLKIRYRPKTFALWHLEAGGRFVPGMGGRAPVLFGLPLLAEWRPSYCLVVEGERDAMRAWHVGIPATCNFDGAGPGKWREGYGFALASLGVRRVYAVPDHDVAGRAHAKAVVTSCRATGLPAWYVSLPGVPAKGDLSDFLDMGHSAADVRRLMQAAREAA
jgi:putative DNA primase/helicase